MSSFKTRGGISIKHADSLILVLTILLARSVTVCIRAEPWFVFNPLRTQNNSNLKAHSLLLYEQRGDILLGKGSVIVKSTAEDPQQETSTVSKREVLRAWLISSSELSVFIPQRRRKRKARMEYISTVQTYLLNMKKLENTQGSQGKIPARWIMLKTKRMPHEWRMEAPTPCDPVPSVTSWCHIRGKYYSTNLW